MAGPRQSIADRSLTRRLTTPPISKRLRLRRRCADILHTESGVAALEFGLLAPVLFFGLLATVDLGFALHERMTMDHILRAGAQIATVDPRPQSIQDTLRATAAETFTVVTTAEALETDPAAVLVSAGPSFHACPEAPDTEVTPSTICENHKPTSIYYRLAAEKFYDGMMLPRMHFAPSLVVQIR